MMINTIISAFQNSTEVYEKKQSMFEDPTTFAFILLNVLIPIIIGIALIYLYVLLVKYLKLKLKEAKKNSES